MAIDMEKQQRIRQALESNKRITLQPSNNADGDGMEWSVRHLKDEQYGVCLVDASGNKEWLSKLVDVTAVIYWLNSEDAPGRSWEWK
jgi:hypothetical protein